MKNKVSKNVKASDNIQEEISGSIGHLLEFLKNVLIVDFNIFSDMNEYNEYEIKMKKQFPNIEHTSAILTNLQMITISWIEHPKISSLLEMKSIDCKPCFLYNIEPKLRRLISIEFCDKYGRLFVARNIGTTLKIMKNLFNYDVKFLHKIKLDLEYNLRRKIGGIRQCQEY